MQILMINAYFNLVLCLKKGVAVKCKWIQMNREGGAGGGREHERFKKEC